MGSGFQSKTIAEAQHELSGCRAGAFGIEAGKQIVLGEFKIDVVDLGLNADLLDLRTIGLGLNLVGLDRFRVGSTSAKGILVLAPMADSRGVVSQRNIGELQLLLLDEALGGNRHFPPALNFLVPSTTSSGATAPALARPSTCLNRSATRLPDVGLQETSQPQPNPKTAWLPQETGPVWFGDPDIRARVGQFRSLSAFSGFTISPRNKGKNPPRKNLLSIVIEAEIGNSRIADRLADASTVAEA